MRKSLTDRRRIGKHKDAGRSRVTNGTSLLPGHIDGRSAWVRRCKDIIALHVSDLGGEDNTSAAERSLVRRAAVLSTQLEMLEAKFAENEQASNRDLDLYIRGSGSLRRLLQTVGLHRRSKEINGVSLGELLREDLRQQQQEHQP